MAEGKAMKAHCAEKVVLAFSLVGALMLAGCSSYAGLRELPVEQTKAFHGAYNEIADCVLDELRIKHAFFRYVQSNRAKDKTSRIAAGFTTLIGTPAPGFLWELAFTQIGENSVLVETRSIHDIWGNSHYPKELWDFVGGCASGPAK